ncbi:MAG: hypothetical protein F4140_07180 [Cenarchaeum sp. SB0675_bin_21]|nr:hypothetical protein [Cenarchaeum sp. SB0675_bin_21]
MTEYEDFVEALFDQMHVELNEESEISKIYESIPDDAPTFETLESVAGQVFPTMQQQAADFLQLPPNKNVRLEYPELAELKTIKGRKVFCNADSKQFVAELFGAVSAFDAGRIIKLIETSPAKYLVYSTYAIQYISKITTTYGDYMDDVIFINKFILKRYPGIILYKMGSAQSNYERVRSGYIGAVKMTVLEESIHSMQRSLYEQNRQAAIGVNIINEKIAQTILDMDGNDVKALSAYLKLQPVPDEFPFAQKANLFFFLNPDHFLHNQIGPDIMTFTHVNVDAKISEYVPKLTDLYMEWLPHIQRHHAAFTVMEGMAAYTLKNILENDSDYLEYKNTFMPASTTTYQVRKDMGTEFVEYLVKSMGDASFAKMLDTPPSTAELKDPAKYIRRVNP